jgi:hypothetical protein
MITKKPARIILLIAICTIASLVGCNPAAQSSSTQPSTSPTATISLEGLISDEAGAVEVVLLYAQDKGRPVKNQILYLADLLPVTGGTLKDAFVPALDATTAPRAETDENGRAIIPMVKPGRYALILMTPPGPILLVREQGGNDAYLIDIEAGKLTNGGEVETFIDPATFEP